MCPQARSNFLTPFQIKSAPLGKLLGPFVLKACLSPRTGSSELDGNSGLILSECFWSRAPCAALASGPTDLPLLTYNLLCTNELGPVGGRGYQGPSQATDEGRVAPLYHTLLGFRLCHMLPKRNDKCRWSAPQGKVPVASEWEATQSPVSAALGQE